MQFTPKTTPNIVPSDLSHGWHPGYILRVVEEPKPDYFTLPSKYNTVWAWHCAIWQSSRDVGIRDPEVHVVYCSPIFSKGGGKGKDGTPMSPSKAYTWVSSLLGRALRQDETPEVKDGTPARIKVQREEGRDWIRIVDFEPWEDAPAERPASIEAMVAFPAMATPQNSKDDDIPF